MKPLYRKGISGIPFLSILSIALVLLPGTGHALAEDPPAIAPPAANDNAFGPVLPAADNSWVDRYHSLVERDLFETVAWFDRFFGDQWMEVKERPASYLRWINEFRWDQEDAFSYRMKARAILRLPRLKEKWRLVISGETKGDPNAVNPEDPGNPGVDVTSRVRTGSTELIYDLWSNSRSTLDLGAGVRVKIPPDTFVRTRFQHARPIAFDTLGRLTAIAFWDGRDGFGQSNQVDFERALAPPTLLRWSNTMTITEKSNGWGWGSELSLLHKLSPKSAITFGGGTSGTTRPGWVAQNFRVYTRYRRNVLRKWFFIEGEPGIRWPRKEDGSRPPVWGATVRFEVLFTGSEPPQSPGPPTPPSGSITGGPTPGVLQTGTSVTDAL